MFTGLLGLWLKFHLACLLRLHALFFFSLPPLQSPRIAVNPVGPTHPWTHPVEHFKHPETSLATSDFIYVTVYVYSQVSPSLSVSVAEQTVGPIRSPPSPLDDTRSD